MAWDLCAPARCGRDRKGRRPSRRTCGGRFRGPRRRIYQHVATATATAAFGTITDALVAELRAVIADLRQHRDHWREQAQRLALPKPPEPKPADELVAADKAAMVAAVGGLREKGRRLGSMPTPSQAWGWRGKSSSLGTQLFAIKQPNRKAEKGARRALFRCRPQE